jgi:hypothetical protein
MVVAMHVLGLTLKLAALQDEALVHRRIDHLPKTRKETCNHDVLIPEVE